MKISKIPTEPNPADSDKINSHTARPWLTTAIVLAVIIAVILLLFNIIFRLTFPYCPPNCSFTPKYSPANFEAEFEKNQAKWDSQHITHYQMSLDPWFSSANFGHTPYVIEVKDGEVIAVVDAQGNVVSIEDNQSFAYSDREFFTVPSLFSYVQHTFLRKPPKISVTYDATYGYPASISVDPYIEPCCQDFTIVVLDFHVLP
jgi:hypothetical protein